MSIVSSSVSILDFAPELVHNILRNLITRKAYEWYDDEPIHNLAAIQAIGACRLTCRYINAVARPLTFHSVSFNCTKSVERISQFLSMLDDNPTLARSVRVLWVHRSSNGSISETGGLDSLITSRKELWNNAELPMIFTRLMCLKMFAFEIFDANVTSNGYSAWYQLGEEMKAGILKLASMPSVTSLKFSNITSLPVGLLASPPNIAHLDINNIDDIHEYHGVRVCYQGSRPNPNLDNTIPQPHYEYGLRVKSLKADRRCTLLYPLHPIAEARLSWDGCDPAHLGAVLRRSENSIRDLSVHIDSMTVQETITFSNALQPRLHTLEFLTKLCVQGSVWTSLSSIVGLAAFLNTQFARPSPRVKHFEIDMTFLPYKESLLEVMSSNNGLPPSQWQDLERAIRISFPNLEILVFNSPTLAHSEELLEKFKVLIQLALPGVKELMRAR
ncbi:hypothetical protein BJ165DRAFT_1503018 [Panaeolus papilionaceus]|nr:hypothetical protein BJ165DRAFT_1503018 [Panaeolus papilionaceus]